jgi:membrane protein YdbS with pleckstrin-like domain
MTERDQTLLEVMEIHSKNGIKQNRFMNKLNFSAVVVLAIGLALNKYVWKSYYLDAYAAGYAALVLICNSFMLALYVSCMETYKEYLPNAKHDEDDN